MNDSLIYKLSLLNSSTYNEIEATREILNKLEHAYWSENVLFSWQWWFLLFSTIIPWVIWWILVDKTRFFEIMTFGFWWLVIATILDVLGVSLSIWAYPLKLTHLMPPLVPADMAVIPVTYMLLYQYSRRWTNFIILSVIVAAVFSYVIEPFFEHFHMLRFLNGSIPWSHLISFIWFFILSMIVRVFHLFIVNKVTTPTHTFHDSTS
ncbi:CBO0543 family protein [Bacillus salitolerans]|uniref:CBO0543 family protein n=1 Tax=Bacillus salitolerans TaxID=1437434 RepID=A0ABW4LWL2_9BACI